jgi:signal peptidase II
MRLTGTPLFGLVILATVLLDQLSKEWVRLALRPGQSWPAADTVIGRYLSFTHVHNTGVAFGLFQGRSVVFALVSSAVILGLVRYQRRFAGGWPWPNVALGLIVGGAIGNVLDRLHQGHVTDFLDFKFWPVFNLADSAVVVGVLMLFWHLLQEDRRERRATAAREPEPGSAGWPSQAEERGD